MGARAATKSICLPGSLELQEQEQDGLFPGCSGFLPIIGVQATGKRPPPAGKSPKYRRPGAATLCLRKPH